MVLSNKEGEYALIVSGTCDGVVFPVWHQQEMNIGDTLTLVYDDVSVDDVSNPIYVDDIRKQEERDLRSLQWWAERKSKMEERKEE